MIRIHTNGRIGVLSPVFTELFLFAAGVRFVPGAVTLAFAMLKVAFAQQQYDGSSWKATGTTDTRQVSFSIAKAKVTAPGTNLTPAANRKSSVKTGDNTPILPFFYILIPFFPKVKKKLALILNEC